MLTPRYFKTSALPHFELMDLLPCFATAAPAPAATNAAAVEILNVPELSPPVPQVSTRCFTSGSILKDFSLMTFAHAVISSIVSPFDFNPRRNRSEERRVGKEGRSRW